MLRMLVNAGRIALLHNLAFVHHKQGVRHVSHNFQIVGNEQYGEAHLLLELVQQVEDLGLNADVQGADGFVAQEQLREAYEAKGCPKATAALNRMPMMQPVKAVDGLLLL